MFVDQICVIIYAILIFKSLHSFSASFAIPYSNMTNISHFIVNIQSPEMGAHVKHQTNFNFLKFLLKLTTVQKTTWSGERRFYQLFWIKIRDIIHLMLVLSHDSKFVKENKCKSQPQPLKTVFIYFTA